MLLDQTLRHRWNLTPGQARQLQEELRHSVILTGKVNRVHLVAGADVAYDRPTRRMFAGIVVLQLPDFQIVETRIAIRQTTFPYIPGLLSFRETPALLAAWDKVSHIPEVLFVDGHGLSHPRRFGLACHLGVIIDRPVIGCAKSRLIGTYEEPAPMRGSISWLYDEAGQIMGAVVRTRDRTRPVFVSVGHRIDLQEAVRITLLCSKGYRLPEPLRQADQFVERIKRTACRTS